MNEHGIAAHLAKIALPRPVVVHGGNSQGELHINTAFHCSDWKLGLALAVILCEPKKRYLSTKLYLSWHRVSMEMLLGFWKGSLFIVIALFANTKLETSATVYAATTQ